MPNQTAKPLVPAKRSLPAVKEAAAECQACPLWKDATQTVFGEGPRKARIVMVGEQPGDQEDKAGKPFVGPAGRVLSDALEKANIDRDRVYITNIVKHFKFIRQGKRRLHKKPNAAEIRACRPWLDAELDLVKPKLVVALGATAAQALMGRDFRVTRQRGKILQAHFASGFLATVHPSSILRGDPERREAAMDALVSDLRKATE